MNLDKTRSNQLLEEILSQKHDRKHLILSISYFGRRFSAATLATTFAILVATCLVSACSSGKKKHRFESSSEALTEYHAFLSSLKGEKEQSIEKLTASVKEWRVLDDSVLNYVSRDTLPKAHSYPLLDYKKIHDSIKVEYLRLAISKPRNYKDVLLFKSLVIDSCIFVKVKRAAEPALPFFSSLNKQSLYKGTKPKMLMAYREFLERTETAGIHTKSQFLSFLQVEDVLFRSFLSQLYDMNDVSVSAITQSTERICKQVMHRAGSEMISSEDAMIYMTMRSNRRLLLNADVCSSDIRTGKVKSVAQQTAYFWMVLQPYISIDDFGMALLTSEQRKQFEKLASDAPQVVKVMAENLDMEREMTDNLPNLFINLYISKL